MKPFWSGLRPHFPRLGLGEDGGGMQDLLGDRQPFHRPSWNIPRGPPQLSHHRREETVLGNPRWNGWVRGRPGRRGEELDGDGDVVGWGEGVRDDAVGRHHRAPIEELAGRPVGVDPVDPAEVGDDPATHPPPRVVRLEQLGETLEPGLHMQCNGRPPRREHPLDGIEPRLIRRRGVPVSC
jgi:hypothetical protein